MVQDFPLTKQQLGLWIETRLHPNNTSYNTCVKVKLTGELDVDKFLNSTRNVIQFFDTLKVYFVEKEGKPFQRIDDSLDYIPELIDISGGAQKETAEKEIEAKKILSDQLNTAIDLTKFPIMRASLIKVAKETYYFIGMVPHIVSDGRAAILYLESLSIAYNQGVSGLHNAYGITKKNWTDYQSDEIDKKLLASLSSEQTHWKKRLQGANHSFDYSYGKQLIDPEDKRGERVYFDLSEDIANRLKKHCKQNRTTLFNVLVCAFSIFNHKYYGLTDLLIGYPVNIRPPGYKHFFGFFVNILPIRVDMRSNPSYQELLKSVHAIRKEDKKYQKYPALDIVADIRQSQPDFDGRVFNLSMAQTVSRLFNLELDGIKSLPLDTDYYDVNDDFSLSYEMIENRIGLWFEYRKALFDKPFIIQAMNHIKTIILQLLEFPEQKIADFQLLSSQQFKDIAEFSKGKKYLNGVIKKLADKSIVKPSEDNHVVSLFEQQVGQLPRQIALIDRFNSIDFLELNQQANQLARHIRSKIDFNLLAKDETAIVAISLPRGNRLIVTLLAVLKSGCAYLPIPPNYPAQRKLSILKKSEASILLLDNSLPQDKSSVLDESSDNKFTTINLDTEQLTIQQQQKANLNIEIKKDSLSYLIYTSGSTGEPKGVAIEHQQLANRLVWLRDYFCLTEKDRMLQNTDFSFDVSVAEIFWPLISGSALAIAEQDYSKDPKALLNWIDEKKITSCCLVPSLLRVLIEHDQNNQLANLKQVLSAGEALHPSLRDLFYQKNSTKKARLYNFYGPTEATIYASFEQVTDNKNTPITIGEALGDTQLWVLDQSKNILPIGVVGELHIAGAGLARGYYNDDTLTDSVFYWVEVNAKKHRMYASGDLAKLTSDGKFEYIARKDKQVKIRGFRVELAEIESIILQSKHINDCAVIYSENNNSSNNNNGQLIAYLASLSSQKNEELIIDDVKNLVEKFLPTYMHPSIYSKTPEIPYLPSGKLNKSLLEKQFSGIITGQEFEVAKTEKEILISQLWSQILSISTDEIGINTSFFDLGGDSLMAIQFVSVAENSGLYFDMGDLFELRHIKALAKVAKVKKMNITHNKVVEGCYPLLPRQAKFFTDNFISPDHWNRTFSFSVPHQLNKKAFEQSIGTVLQHHDNLRIKFIKNSQAEWQQCCVNYEEVKVHLSNIIDYHELSLLSKSEQAREMEKLTNLSHKKMRLDSAPLIRIVYFKLDEDTAKLVIIFHHLLIDMVSSRLIFEDLTFCYQSLINDLPVKLPSKTTSIKQWSIAIQDRLKNEQFTDELNYWAAREIKPVPDLPFSSAGKTQSNTRDTNELNNEESASVKIFTLDNNHTQKLLKVLPKEINMPIQDFLLAILLDVIVEWTGQSEIVVSTCGHGRAIESKEFDLSRTVGWVNTVYPVYLEHPTTTHSGLVTTNEYLQNIKQQLQEVPQDNINYNLLRYSAEHLDICKHPSPKLFFNYVGQIDAFIPKNAPFVPALDLPGIAGIDGRNHLCYQLYFEAGVVAGQLMIRLTYSRNLFHSKKIDELSRQFIKQVIKRLSDING